MNFELDTDQQQLQASLRRLLDSEASFERRRAASATPAGFNAAVWRSMAELGVVAMAMPEAYGGYGLPPVALLPVLQELGRALSLEPYLATAVLGATAVATAGSAAQKDLLLNEAASATRLLAFAHEERAARHARLWVECSAREVDGGWVLHGAKHNVLHGAAADTLVVSARVSGRPDAAEGVALFLVRPGDAGVTCEPVRLVDDTPAAEFHFNGAKAELLGDVAAGAAAILATVQAGMAATCAEALGVAERAYAMTVEYVQTRQQFGRAIGSNQSLRHRVAEMCVALEGVRSAAMIGLLALDMEDAAERALELSRAKMLVSRHATFIAREAIQLHGGMGMTLELAVGHCLRRITVLDQLFGDGPTHAARLGAELALEN